MPCSIGYTTTDDIKYGIYCIEGYESLGIVVEMLKVSGYNTEERIYNICKCNSS